MNLSRTRSTRFILLISFLVLLTGCAAGDTQFTAETQAGFWFGLWHGMISIVTLLIHLFNENVLVYEINNSGGWYDFGFLLGVICIWGGGSHVSCKSAAEKKREKEWEELGEKVEHKVMRKLKAWVKDEETSANQGNNEDWDEIGEKVEKKLKRKIREWAEKE